MEKLLTDGLTTLIQSAVNAALIIFLVRHALKVGVESFGDKIAEKISQLSSVGKDGVQFAHGRAPSQELPPPSATSVVPRELSMEWVDLWVDKLDAMTSAYPPAGREEAKKRLSGVFFAFLNFEWMYVNIYGSQIEALEQLVLHVVPAPKESLRPLYDRGREEFPDLYVERSFKDWCAWMTSCHLIADGEQDVQISPSGQAFLGYIAHQRYPKNLAG